MVTDDDRIGTPGIRNGQVRVDTSRPVVFTLTSHARLESELLLQLNYVIWFPARSLSGRLDLQGGHLDGLTWRVTLGRDWRPLFYDTMHNCGCLYMAFPTDAFEPRPRRAFEEPRARAATPLARHAAAGDSAVEPDTLRGARIPALRHLRADRGRLRFAPLRATSLTA